MNSALEQIIGLIKNTIGRDVSTYDESFFLKSIEKRCTALSITGHSEYIEYLRRHDEEAAELYASLNISFSEFFRNPLTFTAFEHIVLPRLMIEKSGRMEIRIWCAACAAGEEPYSIAMLIHEMLEAREEALSVRIFATDHSPSAIDAAKRGVYTEDAVQHVPLKYFRRYFEDNNGIYVINEAIRNRVDFSVYNLLDTRSSSPAKSIFGHFDAVFCCNLLYYYKPEIQRFLLKKIYQALSTDGYLITSEAEKALIEKQNSFRIFAVPAAIFRKNSAHGEMV
jgi:chemotaxis protein methyltransferase CheR